MRTVRAVLQGVEVSPWQEFPPAHRDASDPSGSGPPTRRRLMRGRPWARRKPRFWPIRQPGDLVQLDTKEVRPARGVDAEQMMEEEQARIGLKVRIRITCRPRQNHGGSPCAQGNLTESSSLRTH
jgi:hypothetical protein